MIKNNYLQEKDNNILIKKDKKPTHLISKAFVAIASVTIMESCSKYGTTLGVYPDPIAEAAEREKAEAARQRVQQTDAEARKEAEEKEAERQRILMKEAAEMKEQDEQRKREAEEERRRKEEAEQRMAELEQKMAAQDEEMKAAKERQAALDKRYEELQAQLAKQQGSNSSKPD